MTKAARFEKRFLSIRLLDKLHHVAGQPSAGQPSAGQPSAGQSSAGQSDTGQPGAGQPGEVDRTVAREAIQKLAAWCEQFSPVVSCDESLACGPSGEYDSLLLDVTGLARLFGGEGALARQVTRKFRRRGLAVQVAVADTAGGAWAVAHFGLSLLTDRRAGQRISESRQQRKWRIPLVIPPGCTTAALGPLPVAALRLPERMLDLLAGLGLHHVGQIAILPRDQLSARFGPLLLERLDQATGVQLDMIHAHHPLPDITAECLLEYPTDRRATIRLVLESLIRKVCDQLSQRGHGALQVIFRLTLQDSDPILIPLGLYRPSAQPRHLMGLADLQLERLALRDQISAVQVTATLTAPLEIRQQELFGSQAESAGQPQRASLPQRPAEGFVPRAAAGSISAEDHRTLAGLVDRLSSRLGRDAVLGVRLLRDAVPECACRLEPLTAAARGRPRISHSSRRGPRRPVLALPALARPLWLEPAPIAVRVVAVVPDGPPLRFHLNQREYTVSEAWGPERIETGWWRAAAPSPVRRDYYRVETTTGQRFWLFRRRDDGRWFLHGEFD